MTQTSAVSGLSPSLFTPTQRCAFCDATSASSRLHRHGYVLWRQARGRVKHLRRGPRFAWLPNLGPWLARVPAEVGLAPARARAAVLPTNALLAAARSMVG